jgi:hypothetical protein
VALLLGFAIRLALFGGARNGVAPERDPLRPVAHLLGIYVIAICAINFLSVIAQCGLDQCHTFGYRLFQ